MPRNIREMSWCKDFNIKYHKVEEKAEKKGKNWNQTGIVGNIKDIKWSTV